MSVIPVNICNLCISSQTQALQSCETSGESLLIETSSHGMHGEPGVHLETYSRSSSLASPVSISSSCGSEYSTTAGSPSGQEYKSVASVRCRQQNRPRIAYQHTVELDTDTGLCLLSPLCAN